MSTRTLLTGSAGVLLIVAAFVIASPGSARGPVPPPTPPPIAVVDTPPNDVTNADGVVVARLAIDQSVLLHGDTTATALVEVRGAEDAAAVRTPVAMALVIDTSGSMAGTKLDQAREAAVAFIERLEDGDVVSVIAYSSSARTVVSAEELGSDRRSLIDAVRGLRSGGGTCMSCGMETGYRLLGEAPTTYSRRALVLSDGQANEGVVDAEALSHLASRGPAAGVVTSTLGLGQDYDERLMEAVAVAASGSYYFLPEASALASIFERELRGAANTVARAVEVRIGGRAVRPVVDEIPGAVLEGDEALITVRQLAAGEIRRFVLPATVSAGSTSEIAVSVRYTAAATGESGTVEAAIRTVRTTDAAVAMASANPDVKAQAELLAAMNEAEEAMAEVRRGDTLEGAARLERVMRQLEEESEALGDARLGAEADNMRALRDAVSAPGFAGDGEDGRGLYLQNSARSGEAARGVAVEQMYHSDTVY